MDPFNPQPTGRYTVFPSSALSNKTANSTPAVIAKPVNVLPTIAKTAKDFFTGSDATTGGIIRNTVTGLPKATVDTATGIGKNLYDMVANPSDEQKNYEAQALPYPTNPVAKVLGAPGVAAARIITRVINPGLMPVANDLAEITAVNEKGGIADQVASGKIPASYLDELAVLHKTAPQITGDVAQAVLTAYSGGEGSKLVQESDDLSLIKALATGFKGGLKMGTLFGGAQAASNGSGNPLEIASTVGTSGFAGGLLGAIISGAIPASREVVDKVKDAKVLYDSMIPG